MGFLRFLLRPLIYFCSIFIKNSNIMRMKVLITTFFLAVGFMSTWGQSPALKTSYNFPATDANVTYQESSAWESLALPLGNGHIGAMVFGDVPVDIIQMNEKTVWSGGPGENPNYNGGHLRTPAQNHQTLQNLRNSLQKKMTDFKANRIAKKDASGKVISNDYPDETTQERADINNLIGSKNGFGSYQTLSNINIAYSSVIMPEIINITGNCDNPRSSGEKFPSLFDGSVNTKWFSDSGFSGFPCFISWEYQSPFSVSAYTLTSGNDMQSRDPKSWKLYGSNDGNNFTLIDTRENITFPDRRQSLKFNLSKTETYKHFKFEITATYTANTPPQLSEISLEDANVSQVSEYTNYSRELDVDNAVSKIMYLQAGVNYTREYFISHPDNVFVIRLSADKPGNISRTFYFTSMQTSISQNVKDNVITMSGKPASHSDNGLKFVQQMKIIPTGGTLSINGSQITVEGADEILILSSAATNYRQSMGTDFNYFSDVNPLTTVENTLNRASQKTYAELLKTHKDDYKSLYDRMSVSLGNASNKNNKTTDKLLAGYKNGSNTAAENLYLEQLYYQFGRYLLISSSREGTLPANLQGIWAEGLMNPWAADYHTNINVQMNYWLAQQTNLAECHLPVVEYVKSLVPRGTISAQHYYCKQDGGPVRGWVIHHENNIWGNTAPGTHYWGFYFPAAAAWMCQDIWEYYNFNQDKQFLADNFNVLLNAALFWVDNLWRDSRDGTLVTNPSYSPEHGPYSLGASCDQAIIWELFDMVIKASDILGNKIPEVEEVKTAKNRLAGPQIGLAGQFLEWKDEITMDITGDGGHRHVNHLHWLHPGSQIVAGRSPQEDLYAKAMKVTLNTRGDGGTGWSKAWKINFWARLRDGNRSHKLVQEILKESTLTNLFDTHPPFQIDGNFGSTAGMTEMLVQSQGDCIEILPALPDAWSTGSFKGIKARGNFEIDAEWSNGKVTSLKITSGSGNNCVVKCNGKTLPSFPTTKGTVYDLSHEI